MAKQHNGGELHPYAKALQSMTERYERLVQVLSILRRMDELDDPGAVLEGIMGGLIERIAAGLAAENCSLMLLDETSGTLWLRAACSPLETEVRTLGQGEWEGWAFRVGEGVVGKVAQTGQAIRVDDVTEHEAFVPIMQSQVRIRSLMCFPLKTGDRVIGVLNLSHSHPCFFNIESESTLSLVAERAARMLVTHGDFRRQQEAEDHFCSVAEAMGDALIVLDSQHNVLSANPAAGELSGVDPAALRRGDVTWESFLAPKDRQRFTACVGAACLRRQPSTLVYEFARSSGGLLTLEQRTSPLSQPGESVAKAVCVIRDVSRREGA